MAVGKHKTYAVLKGCSEYNFGLAAIPPLKANIAGLQALLSNEKYEGLSPENIFTCEPATKCANDDIPAFCNDATKTQDKDLADEDEVSFGETEQLIKQYVDDCLSRTGQKQQNNAVPEKPVTEKKNMKRMVLSLLLLVTFGALGATYSFIFKTDNDADSRHQVASIPSKQTTSNGNGKTQSLKRNNVKQKFVSASAPAKDAGVIAETLENMLFVNFAADKNLKLFGIEGTTASFQGKLCAYNVYGKVKLKGKTFVVISGNIKGQFSISGDSSTLTGNVVIEAITPCVFELSRQQREEINVQ